MPTSLTSGSLPIMPSEIIDKVIRLGKADD